MDSLKISAFPETELRAVFMITSLMEILLFGLGVLGLAVATAVHDTWWLQRKTKKPIDCQESLRGAA